VRHPPHVQIAHNNGIEEGSVHVYARRGTRINNTDQSNRTLTEGRGPSNAQSDAEIRFPVPGNAPQTGIHGEPR
jgi:hypothetical protein